MNNCNKNHNKYDFYNDLFSNPVHGQHGKDHQMNIVIQNNIILYDYFFNIWSNFKNYFK